MWRRVLTHDGVQLPFFVCVRRMSMAVFVSGGRGEGFDIPVENLLLSLLLWSRLQEIRDPPRWFRRLKPTDTMEAICKNQIFLLPFLLHFPLFLQTRTARKPRLGKTSVNFKITTRSFSTFSTTIGWKEVLHVFQWHDHLNRDFFFFFWPECDLYKSAFKNLLVQWISGFGPPPEYTKETSSGIWVLSHTCVLCNYGSLRLIVMQDASKELNWLGSCFGKRVYPACVKKQFQIALILGGFHK